MTEEELLKYKIIVLSIYYSGKTSLIARYTRNIFNDMSPSETFSRKNVILNDGK